MTWTAPQAEAWMRENPGRWLETTMGDLVCAHESGTLRRPVYLLLRVGSREARRIETLNGFDFHPPREHYAAERDLYSLPCCKCGTEHKIRPSDEFGSFECCGRRWNWEAELDLRVHRDKDFHAALEVDGE